MTTVSFRDAAVLSYLARHEKIRDSERSELTGSLTGHARQLAKAVEKERAAKSSRSAKSPGKRAAPKRA
jgi:hypothetical protein